MGKAAIHPPALVVLSHTPSGATKTIAWVGKGIVYDTGGLSLKTKVERQQATIGIMIIIIIIITVDWYARNEARLWWSSWYIRSISYCC